MTNFSFKSDHFELSLEGYEDPISIFKEVADTVANSPKKNVKREKEAVLINDELALPEHENSYSDIDEYFAKNKPSKLRDVLEGAVIFIATFKGQKEFAKDEIFDAAKASLHYDTGWTKNRASTFDRMIKDGFLGKRPEGKFVYKGN